MIKMATFLIGCALVSSCKDQEKITEHIYKLTDNSQISSASIADFSLLEGFWNFTELDSQVIEKWKPPKENFKTGTFIKFIEGPLDYYQDGENLYTETLLLYKDSISYFLRMTRFSYHGEGWQHINFSTDYRLIKKKYKTLYFNGLTAIRKDENHLNIYRAFTNNDGLTKEELFNFTKNEIIKNK